MAAARTLLLPPTFHFTSPLPAFTYLGRLGHSLPPVLFTLFGPGFGASPLETNDRAVRPSPAIRRLLGSAVQELAVD